MNDEFKNLTIREKIAFCIFLVFWFFGWMAVSYGLASALSKIFVGMFS